MNTVFVGCSTASAFDITTVKKITQNIVEECAKMGEEISEMLASYILKLFILTTNTRLNEYSDSLYKREEHILQLCCKKIVAMKTPSIETVKMQILFDTNYISSGIFFVQHRKSMQDKLAPLEGKIMSYKMPHTLEMELLYNLVLAYVIQRTGLGESKYIGVKQESSAALQSVCSFVELDSFCCLLDDAKEAYLDELAETVGGIRLFHRDSGKGGTGIPDVPGILNECIPTLLFRLESEISICMKQVNGIEGSVDMEEIVKLSIANIWQYVIYCIHLLNEVKAVEVRSHQLQIQYRRKLNILHKLIETKSALPSVQVFPQFVKTFKMWNLLQQELLFLSDMATLFSSLRHFSQNSKIIIQTCLEEKGFHKEAEQNLIESVSGIDFEDGDKDITIYYPSVIKNMDEIVLYYQGFCPWMFVEAECVLKPAIRAFGIVLYKEKCYGFCCEEAMKAFARQPENYRERIKDLVLRYPEFILLLGMEEDLQIWLSKRALHSLKNWPAIKVDGCMQTDSNPYEKPSASSDGTSAIKSHVPREAIQQSTQTLSSGFRMTIGIQSCIQKDVCTQTRTEKSTQTLDFTFLGFM